jgi:hypothetical protein
MPREPKLDMLPDKDMKLTGSHFRKVVRRIESIVPIAGDGIKVEPVDGGHKITADLPELAIITLNVCSNGVPDTVDVYGPSDSEAFGV